MPAVKGLEWTFDTNAEEYEKLRPGYVRELYDDIFNYCPLGDGSAALEVGIGGGQATRPVLDTGCRVTAVEYGANFTALCREKFAEYPGFSAVTARFEEYEGAKRSFDLIFSASAFHWVPESVGYAKVYDLLKPGGAFARFANHPYKDKGREPLHAAIQKLYAVYLPRSRMSDEYSARDAEKRANIAAKYGFTDIKYELYRRTRTFSSKEYAALLGTYSDHIALGEETLGRFSADIERTIDNFGGEITIYDTIDLELARKPREA